MSRFSLGEDIQLILKIGFSCTLSICGLFFLLFSKNVLSHKDAVSHGFSFFFFNLFFRWFLVGCFLFFLLVCFSWILGKIHFIKRRNFVLIVFSCFFVFFVVGFNSGSLSYSFAVAIYCFVVLYVLLPLLQKVDLRVFSLIFFFLIISMYLFGLFFTDVNKVSGNFPLCSGESDPLVFSGNVYVLGFDGASWDVMKPLVDAGKMPNLLGLMENGVFGNLTSFKYNDKIMSPVVWTSIFSGETPKDHGISDYVVIFLNDNYLGFYESPYTSDLRRVSGLWNILSDFGFSNVFSGLWSTWPAEVVDGVMISDHAVYAGWHESYERIEDNNVVFPLGFSRQIDDYLNRDQSYVSRDISRFTNGLVFSDSLSFRFLLHPTDSGLDDRLKLAYYLDEFYFNMGVKAISEFSPRFSFIYLEGLDMVQHYFWGAFDPGKFDLSEVELTELEGYAPVIPEFYIYYDELLGEIVENAGVDDVFIIVSDHGLGPVMGGKGSGGYQHVYADHTLNGVFVFSGGAFREDIELRDMSVLDVTPSMLYFLGLPVGDTMDGVIRYDLFKDDFVKSQKCKLAHYERVFNSKNGERMDAAMVEKLKSLGYI